MGDPAHRLQELDERHDELLARLAELDKQITSVLEDWTKTKELSAIQQNIAQEGSRPVAA